MSNVMCYISKVGKIEGDALIGWRFSGCNLGFGQKLNIESGENGTICGYTLEQLKQIEICHDKYLQNKESKFNFKL